MDPWRFNERLFLVTGASSGIGRQTAILLSNLGARIVAVGRNEERLEETRSAMHGGGHVVVPYDLSKFDEVATWLRGVAGEHGPLAGLVHSAGIQSTRPLALLKGSDLRDTLRINLESGIALAKGFQKKSVRHADGGSIVFVASVAGLVGEPGLTAYSASKGALISATRAMAVELARERIRVNCVAPGMVDTPMLSQIEQAIGTEPLEEIRARHPLGFGDPEDVSHAVAFLLGETGRWITGTTLTVDGGYTAH